MSAPAVQAAIGRLVGELRGDPEVAAAYFLGPAAASSTGRPLRAGDRRDAPRVRLRGGAVLCPPSARTLIPSARFPASVQVEAGGGPPQGVDFLHVAYGAFPWLVLAVLLLTYLLLMRAFRSLMLPLKAVLLNLLSVAAAYGMLVVVFRFGLGEDVLGLYQFPQIEGWIPIFLFAMLFGLSMDYEVFIVCRMREDWDETHDNERAVALRARAHRANHHRGGPDHGRRVLRLRRRPHRRAAGVRARARRRRSSLTRRSCEPCSSRP